MARKIGLQLYSVREEMGKDFEATIRSVAEMGYAGVEPAGFPGSSPEKAAKLFQELGLAVPSIHAAKPVGDDKNEVLDTAEMLGCKWTVSGFGPQDLDTVDKIKARCEVLNEAAVNCAERGIAFGYHNHWWEYQAVEGRLVAEHMLEELRQDVMFEIDTYWVKTGGPDPVEIIKKWSDRIPLLHIKDGPCEQGEPMTAAGSGTMDFPPIVAAATSAEWLIVELDACATDMMEAVEQSCRYLADSGLGEGKA
jgi:sugar phosphate isomerase/epimerase